MFLSELNGFQRAKITVEDRETTYGAKSGEYGGGSFAFWF